MVVFTSKPYDEALLRSGGTLAGDLSIRGITRPRTLQVAPSTCARPAVDCDVVASGAVRRSDYDMDDWHNGGERPRGLRAARAPEAGSHAVNPLLRVLVLASALLCSALREPVRPPARPVLPSIAEAARSQVVDCSAGRRLRGGVAAAWTWAAAPLRNPRRRRRAITP